jgi:hypothetical protein
MTGSEWQDDVGGAARQPAESRLAAEQLLAAIVRGSHDAILAKDREARITLWNPAAEELYGYSAAEALGRPVAMIVPPERAGEEMEILKRVLTGELVEHYETERQRADGSRVHVWLSVAPLRDASGNVVGASTIARDISRRRAEEAERALLASLVDASADAIVSVSRERVILSWNQAAQQLFRLDPERAVGYRLDEVFALDASESQQRDETLARVFDNAETLRYEVRRTLSGTPLTLAVTMSPVLDRDGTVAAACVICRDVSEQQRLERRVQQAQRIEAVGRLAGGIAHDFNNLLTVITGYTRLALASVRDGPGADELREVQHAADRAAELTMGLLDFSRQRAIDPIAWNLNDTIAGVLSLLDRLIGEDIRIVVHTDEDVAAVMADPGQLEQVLMNLALNARDAMPDGGALTIETRSVTLAPGHSEEEAGLAAGRYACLTVTDTGVGIDPALMDHLFEPFVTTKEAGEGTGLGLATVHGIVGQAGGTVRVYSEPGHGATFRVYLPATTATPEQRTAAPAPTGPDVNRETLLVCEDDDAVRALIERVLAGAGYTVLAAATPDHAMRLARGSPRPDAMISDTIMPGLTGPQLAERIAVRVPGLPTLFISGYTADVIRDRGQLPSGSAYLEKPFTPEGLLDAVRALLNRR